MIDLLQSAGRWLLVCALDFTYHVIFTLWTVYVFRRRIRRWLWEA